MRTLLILFCIIEIILIVFLLGENSGQKAKQQEIENRAKQINKECYTNQELEIIIFGEIQE